MYSRLLKISQKKRKSFFLFGPRGTGKTVWVRSHFPEAIYLDLLRSDLYTDLSARPERLEKLIPPSGNCWVVIDEVQKVPGLLNEVHRLIEEREISFALTGSSARTLRKKGVNLLAGRALTYHMHPMTTQELGNDFDFDRALKYGLLPSIPSETDPEQYLESYVSTYLREEVLQEGLTRNIGSFSRFLETASFSQGEMVNLSQIARESSIHRKVVESYFQILEDLLIGIRIPVFSRRAKRQVTAHPKFYLFDVGVYRTIRPQGPLDTDAEIDGPALETLLLQELRAYNDYLSLAYTIYYWRTTGGQEVDFVLYGPRGLIAIEVKRSRNISKKELSGLQAFGVDYPEAKLLMLYGGSQRQYFKEIEAIPFQEALQTLPELLGHEKSS